MLWLFLCLLPIILWYFNYFKYERHLKDFPGPFPLPILGSLLYFLHPKVSFETFAKFQKIYGTDYKIYFGFEPMIVLTDEESIEYFLTSTKLIDKPPLYSITKSWFRNGLLVSGGEYWRRHRKVITPAFHFKILEQYVRVFDSVGKILVEKLKREDDRSIDVYPYFSLCALDVMLESTMGTTPNTQINSDTEYVHSIKRIGDIFLKRMFSPLLKYDFIFQFTNLRKQEKECLDVLHGYSKGIIQSRKAHLLRDEQNPNKIDTGKKLAFLDLLLSYASDGNGFTDDEINEEVDMILFEGHDTTASTLSFVLYQISKHPEVREKITEELDGIFYGDKEREVTIADIQNMKYLEMVIKETLRMYPIAPFYFRKVTETVTFNGRTYPEGASVAFLPFGTHMDARYYREPERFFPERFEPNSGYRTGGTFSYIPFSAGPRNCIGQKFAMLEMKSVLANILRNFNVSTPEFEHKLVLEMNCTLRTTTGNVVHITIKK